MYIRNLRIPVVSAELESLGRGTESTEHGKFEWEKQECSETPAVSI